MPAIIPPAVASAAGAALGSSSGLGGIGSVLSGIGSLGGLFGSKGLSPRKSAALQYEYQKHWWRDLPGLAKEAGLSPLVLAGATGFGSVTPQAVPGSRDVGAAARGVGQAISQREAHARAVQTQDLQDELLASQSDYYKASAANQFSQAAASANQNTRAPIPLLVPYTMPDGSERMLLNPDVADAEQLMFELYARGYDSLADRFGDQSVGDWFSTNLPHFSVEPTGNKWWQNLIPKVEVR